MVAEAERQNTTVVRLRRASGRRPVDADCALLAPGTRSIARRNKRPHKISSLAGLSLVTIRPLAEALAEAQRRHPLVALGPRRRLWTRCYRCTSQSFLQPLASPSSATKNRAVGRCGQKGKSSAGQTVGLRRIATPAIVCASATISSNPSLSECPAVHGNPARITDPGPSSSCSARPSSWPKCWLASNSHSLCFRFRPNLCSRVFETSKEDAKGAAALTLEVGRE